MLKYFSWTGYFSQVIIRNIMKYLLFLSLFCLIGCSPTSLDEYHYEGESVARQLLIDLEKVNSQEELISQSSKLKKRFSTIVDLVIAARKHQLKHPDDEITTMEHTISDLLKNEFTRIYQIEGCQGIMESMQRESLHRLDRFNNKE